MQLRTFNESRYLITLEEYFRTGRVPTIAEVNSLERVTIGQAVSVSLKIRIGLSIQALTDNYQAMSDIEKIIMPFDKTNEKFFLTEEKKYMGIYLHVDARPMDVLKAYFFAVCHLQDRVQLRDRSWEVQNKWSDFLTLAQREGKWIII